MLKLRPLTCPPVTVPRSVVLASRQTRVPIVQRYSPLSEESLWSRLKAIRLTALQRPVSLDIPTGHGITRVSPCHTPDTSIAGFSIGWLVVAEHAVRVSRIDIGSIRQKRSLGHIVRVTHASLAPSSMPSNPRRPDKVPPCKLSTVWRLRAVRDSTVLPLGTRSKEQHERRERPATVVSRKGTQASLSARRPTMPPSCARGG